MSEELKITEFREDGWPLCPQCGEDELFRFRDTDPLKCYYCKWEAKESFQDWNRRSHE